MGFDLAVTPDGGQVFVAGAAAAYNDLTCGPVGRCSPITSSDVLTLAYDSQTGNQQWVARYNECPDNPLGEIDYASFVRVTPDGSMVVPAIDFIHGDACPKGGGTAYSYGSLAYPTSPSGSAQAPDTAPPSRSGAGVASNADVGVGSTGAASTGSETRPEPGPWKQVANTIPRSRFSAAMAYDGANDELVLFGGCCNPDGKLDDTWTWDGTTWSEQHPAVSPAERQDAAMVYDAATHQVVLFGGIDHSLNPLNDTWTWDGTTWTQQHPATSPPARSQTTMAYDAQRGEVVLFGGCCGSSDYPLGDTWTWDGTTWTERHPATSPPALSSASSAYDAGASRVVLFGGRECATASCSASNATWTWDGTTWTQQHPDTSPAGRVQAGMAYDDAAGKLVLFGGASNPYAKGAYLGVEGSEGSDDTWTWDGTTWARRADEGPPPVRAGSLAYDAATRQVVSFGGRTCYYYFECPAVDGTWMWDGARWTELPRTLPPDRRDASLVFDAASGQVVLFGGCCSDRGDYYYPPLNDTWTWDGTTWTQQHPAASPPPRQAAAMAYDADNDRVVLFGGYTLCKGTCNNRFADTWTYDGSTWTEQDPLVSPPALAWGSMAYDPATHQVVLFGGDMGGRDSGATWTWDGSAWTEQHPAMSPSPRQRSHLAYDAATGQLLLFGGCAWPCAGGDRDERNDTWTWDGTNWTELHPATSPSHRDAGAMAYDTTSKQIVLFGGREGYAAHCPHDDTWGWDGTTWTQLDGGAPRPRNSVASNGYCSRSSPGRPSARSWPAATENPSGGILLLIGGVEHGAGGGGGLNVKDMWTLNAPEGQNPGTASTTLTTSRSRTPYRKPFELSGKVTLDEGCGDPTYYTISLAKRVHGTTRSRTVASAIPVASDGSWAHRRRSKRSASYVATVSSTRVCDGTRSSPRDVATRAKVKVELAGSCGRRGHRIMGRVFPRHRGTRVLLQRRKPEGWKVVDRDVLNRYSRFRLRAPRCKGRYRVLWRSQAKDNLRGWRAFKL